MHYKRDQIALPKSCSHLTNNLCMKVIPGGTKPTIIYTVIHGSHVVILTVTDNYKIKDMRCCEASSSSSQLALQAKILQTQFEQLVAVAVLGEFQIYDLEGTLRFKHQICVEDKYCFGRGFAAVDGSELFVGTQKGEILSFSVSGFSCSDSFIKVSGKLKGHRWPITDLCSKETRLVSSDDDGTICVWEGKPLKLTRSIPGKGSPATSLGVFADLLVAGYASGQLRVYSVTSGVMCAEASAHARAISAVDVSKTGVILSVGCDSYARLWQLKSLQDTVTLEYRHSEFCEGQELVGGCIHDDEARRFLVTAYDHKDITVFART